MLVGMSSLDKSGLLLGVGLAQPTTAELKAKDKKTRVLVWINKPEGGQRVGVEIYKEDLVKCLNELEE